MRTRFLIATAVLGMLALEPGTGRAAENPDGMHSGRDALSELPDWSGIWIPDVRQQLDDFRANEAPWKPQVAKRIDEMIEEKDAGRPYGLFLNCKPFGMPNLTLIIHNAIEFLFTPGRVTLLGEGDGNRLRRIYTDGRPLPENPEPSYHGYSVGHWDGDTLVVDTVGILPEVYLAPDENVGVPNGGGMRIRERIYLENPETLRFDVEITAPEILSDVWKTTRYYSRMQGPGAEIYEGICLPENQVDRLNEDGRTEFAPSWDD